MNVLVIDDDEGWGRIMAAILALRCGAHTDIATTLSTGRTLAAYGHYGLVLLDLTLPDAWPDQSFEAVREFKALGLRVAIVTGSHLTGDLLKQANISGADALVAKDCRTFEQCLVDVVDGRPVEKGC